ncbi:sensor histidine kinase [Aerococcaceae bacterium DSM 109653]|uniref:Sensor histidine kinase n=1 Tax=Fundicoccus ignavus TaxID=2664442 RepID=A0A6I2GLH6_9LACT|nr:sensor histidine kinase [Fundicoccus ignavus]MRI81423.1 sensor histidine kinase [Fundicoccus ignavus]MRI85408.1 sensor histidine kinase [Fundicoccus ignavus]
MNLRLWFRLFLNQVFISISFVVVIILIIVGPLAILPLDELLFRTVFRLPFILVLLAFIVASSAVYAVYIAFSLNEPYEQIRAKINWLLLGKYKHSIFNQEVNQRSWYDNDKILSNDINRIRERLVQLSADLQEFTAAPVFVGEDTKEEIIEKERSRIARELHDSVSQQLFAAMMMLSAINETIDGQLSEPIKKQLIKVEEVIGNAQTEMRALLLHLRPVALEDRSLKQGITNLLEELYSKVSLELKWELMETTLDSGIEDHLFRIVQEAVSNTLRHAKANKLEVYLNQTQDSVTLKIVDNGVGFESNQPDKVGSYGLRNMRERVVGLGGTFKIVSIKQQGTIVDISIPV